MIQGFGMQEEYCIVILTLSDYRLITTPKSAGTPAIAVAVA